MNNFQDKNIWIIGASSGIGKALAIELASKGATIILSARRADQLEAIIPELQGRNHKAVALDVGEPETIGSAVSVIKENFQRIDIIIFLAAIYTPTNKDDIDLEFIDKALRVNIGGAFNIVHYVTPLLEAQGGGQIALCGSVAGYRGLPNGQPYSATKAAINNYAESLKIELEPKNIDVRLISPGFVKTALTDQNEFDMPFIIETDEAARGIAKGLLSKSFEIHFPKKFTFIMKAINILPNALFFKLFRKIFEKSQAR